MDEEILLLLGFLGFMVLFSTVIYVRHSTLFFSLWTGIMIFTFGVVFIYLAYSFFEIREQLDCMKGAEIALRRELAQVAYNVAADEELEEEQQSISELSFNDSLNRYMNEEMFNQNLGE